MKKLLLSCCLLAFSSSAAAKVGFVDVEAIVATLMSQPEVATMVNERFKGRIERIERLKEDVSRSKTNPANTSSGLSNLEKTLALETTSLQLDVDEYTVKIRTGFLNKVRDALNEMKDKKGYEAILDRNTAVIFDSQHDLTKSVHDVVAVTSN